MPSGRDPRKAHPSAHRDDAGLGATITWSNGVGQSPTGGPAEAAYQRIVDGEGNRDADILGVRASNSNSQAVAAELFRNTATKR